ncbi:glycosyltransferase N-terminal domain-containing protein [Psittacicella gerlachiana]|uniref:glycosyltransferase N-terminal domain-containing protein n=1 Tax=Psittacicella gerlachiana TaxID=2028574 RepID=UPI001CA7468B|nr:glycosyltransferase N-terminal domain-containing protein [Psittacicella gerlachiana]
MVKFYFKRRGKKDPNYLTNLQQRFKGDYQENSSLISQCKQYGSLHIHAASLGEVNLILSFIEQYFLLQQNGLLKEDLLFSPIVITTNTPTGLKAAKQFVKKFSQEQITVVYTPLEYERAINNFIHTFHPKVSLFVETELWPLFIRKLKETSQLYLINARLSVKNFSKYQKGLLNDSIMSFKKVIAQDATNASIYQALISKQKLENLKLSSQEIQYGISASLEKNLLFKVEPKLRKYQQLINSTLSPKVFIGNNLKFNKHSFNKWSQVTNLLYKFYRQQNKVNLLLASTYPDEVEITLQAIKSINNGFNLVVAPRHPENFTKISQLLKDNNWVVTSLSSMQEQYKSLMSQLSREVEKVDLNSLSSLSHSELLSFLKDNNQNLFNKYWDKLEELLGFNHPRSVLLIDTIGDLASFYQLMDLTIVGGTFNKVGGHDLIDPISHLNSIIIGPNYKNQLGVVDSLSALNCVNVIEPYSKNDAPSVYVTNLQAYIVTYIKEYQSLTAKELYSYIEEQSSLADFSDPSKYRFKELLAYKYFLNQQNALLNHLKILEMV